MEIFIDSADLEEIRIWSNFIPITGVTTNPSSLGKAIQEWAQAKKGRGERITEDIAWQQVRSHVTKICSVAKGRPVSVQGRAYPDENEMLQEGKNLVHDGASISSRNGHQNTVVVKLPITDTGLRVCRRLTDKGIECNMTLCFHPIQALMAAEAGAAYVSPFVGRLEILKRGSGLDLVDQIRKIYDLRRFKTRVLAASIRSADQLVEVWLRGGADIATVPASVLEEAHQNKHTEAGQKKFMDDWKNSLV